MELFYSAGHRINHTVLLHQVQTLEQAAFIKPLWSQHTHGTHTHTSTHNFQQQHRGVKDACLHSPQPAKIIHHCHRLHNQRLGCGNDKPHTPHATVHTHVDKSRHTRCQATPRHGAPVSCEIAVRMRTFSECSTMRMSTDSDKYGSSDVTVNEPSPVGM